MNDARKQTITTVPRWTSPSELAHGEGSHILRLPSELTAALQGLAAKWSQPVANLVAAAHARVLATVMVEQEILIGFVPPQWPPRETLVSLGVSRSSWADLVSDVAKAVLSPIDTTLRPEVVLDLSSLVADGASDAANTLHDGAVLTVAFGRDAEDLTLSVAYDRDALDESYAERLAGYHVTALTMLVAGPGERHDRQSLLSAAEVETLVYGLGGPRAELPDRTFAELFEDRVRTQPTAVAVQHGDRRWTYAELDEHANRIAHALLAAGLQSEDVVAVVLDRTLEWIAAALAVFKAGGVYLPVRPDFPTDRVATQIERSGCAFVLVDQASMELARAASARVTAPPVILSMLDILMSNGPAHPPAVKVIPGQAAYIYFTSGSTGAPKGALCEHAGMLNHLYMKIEDFGMAEGSEEVVTQTASQCFDISLWQFAAPLLIGGKVCIVDTDVLLDVTGFLDVIRNEQVTVAQIVPSYLEVLLTHLDKHPCDLGALRIVSVTGEALKYELVQRWFAVYPHIKLANAYGATEVSDDTMHEILDGVPERDFITVGRSLRNVNTYILDASLGLVPLGSVGEIAFSGVCVGRGYINDEERTREAFVADPFRPATRMYRTGDYGRWLPEGRIEYRGRRDEQVKINGFRIELGEIENKLLALDGVREAAVVIDGGSGESRNLVAFYSGSEAVTAGQAREYLSELVPGYMMPTYFHCLERLPLTENGKIDKKALGRLAGTLGHGDAAYATPATASERRLAMLWAEVLGVPVERIGRSENFFELGGTSLAAVRLLVRLDKAISLKDLVATPVLSALAATLDSRSAGNNAALSAGLLQSLSPVRNPRYALVCFPYAGGNAVNFRSLATALAPDGIEVLAVELPGHDIADDVHALEDLPAVARRVLTEITERVTVSFALWGHCAGAAIALETARLLEAHGAPAERVFIGALALEDPATLRGEIDEVTVADDRSLLDRLRADSAYVELDGLKPERAAVVSKAYRHDVVAADNYLLGIHQDPAAHRLGAPVDVVLSRDDSSTVSVERRHAGWEALSDHVALHELECGGHYFVSTRPAETAELVRARCLRAERQS
jgi:amino acid adenylation domain-containing protein